MRKNRRGITLITLVITIIVLLILATVSISLVVGDNGIINKAKNAKTETRDADEKEKVELAVASAKVLGEGELTEENLNAELERYFEGGALTKESDEEKESLLPKEYQQVEYIESTGTQWIDTKYHSNVETNVKIEFSYIQSNGDPYSNGFIFGSANTNTGTPGLSIGITLDDKLYYRNSNKAETFNSTFNINTYTRYFVDTYKNEIIIDDNNYYSTMELINSVQDNSSYLFARNTSGLRSVLKIVWKIIFLPNKRTKYYH